MRLRAIRAIAARDLAMQLRGRRAWVMPLIASVLLVPLASIPLPKTTRVDSRAPYVQVQGDVPQALHDHELVRATGRGTVLRRVESGLVVETERVPSRLRTALDDTLEVEPPPPVQGVRRPPWPMPGRTLLLALIAASLLTGAVSESLPGERGRNTLDALLTAAIGRGELVLGKWLAWGGMGALLSTAAGGMALATGNATLGPWLLALPLVPPATVALGMYLVRHTGDLVGGATVSLRVIPAVLSTLGLVAWGLGFIDPLLGAAVPLGGALVMAGDTWPGWAPTLTAVASTGAATIALLWGTRRGLDHPAPREDRVSPITTTLVVSGVALAWWGALLGPRLWAPAGNATLADALDPSTALLAGSLALLMIGSVRAAGPTGWPGVRLHAPPARSWLLAALALPLALLLGLSPLGALPGVPATLLPRLELGLAATPGTPLAGLIALVAQELLFRGMIPELIDPRGRRSVAWELVSAGLFAAIITPHRPLEGLLLALALNLLARHTGSILPGLLARCLALGAAWGLAALWPALFG